MSSAALCKLRAGTAELCSSVGAMKGTRAISTNNPSGQGATNNQAGEAFGKEAEASGLVIYPFSQGEEQRWRELNLSC